MGFSWPIVDGLGDYLKLMLDVGRTAIRHELETDAWALQVEQLQNENKSLREQLKKQYEENCALRRYTSELEDRAYLVEDEELCGG